jgi:hypothetical protein
VLGDVEEQMRGWAERLVAMCGDDPHRLAALVKMTRNIPEDVATRILNRVDAIVPRRAHVDPEGQILAAVRRELAYLHEGNRARGRGRLDRLGRLCEALAPADPVDQDAWLFQTYPQIPGLRASDLGAQKEQGAVERSKAVARMSAMPDAIEILRRLCTLVPDPELLGEALAKSELSSVLVERVIATGDSSLSVPVASMILAMHADSSDRGLGWLSGVLATLADAGHIELVVRTLLRKSSDCATWDVVASLGEIVHQRYWACVRWVHDQSPSGIERAVSELLAAHRPDMVLQTAFFALESQSLSPESALRVLERLQDAWRPEMAGGMFEYQLAKVFNKADESGQESALSDLEQSFFFVLVDSEHPPRRLFDRLGSDPRLFAEMVSKVDQQDAPLADAGPDEGDPSASETHGALVYEAVLRAWDGFPGDSVADVRERERLLRDWATEVLRQTASMGAGSAGQVRVADILARPPTAEDGAWPAIAARELIESGNFPIFKRHISIEKANSRGVTHRSLLDGGNQERHLASVYSDWARVVDAKWPSTAVILRALAADLDHEGRAHDDEAASARIRHGA